MAENELDKDKFDSGKFAGGLIDLGLREMV